MRTEDILSEENDVMSFWKCTRAFCVQDNNERFIMAISMSLQTPNETIFPSRFTYNSELWTTVKLCGEGTFSKCFQMRNKHGRNLAVKAYKPGGKYESGFQNEVEMLSLVKMNLKSSPVSYIVNYIDMFTVSGAKCILMEYLGCNLKELLIKHEMKGFSLYLVKKIIHDLLSAAIYLEEVGIVHGDIKPSNILWNMKSECFQLIDFSISFKSKLRSSFDQPLQSPGYQAPEVLEWNRNIKGKYTPLNSIYFTLPGTITLSHFAVKK